MHRSCDRVMPLAKASENAKTSFLFHDISDGMKYVQLTLKNVVQNRQYLGFFFYHLTNRILTDGLQL
jgi:hypothetical protein